MINGRYNKTPSKDDVEINNFLQSYTPTELITASEFLSNWLPFLPQGLCDRCSVSISNRVRSLTQRESAADKPQAEGRVHVSTPNRKDLKDEIYTNDTDDTNSLDSWKNAANGFSEQAEETSGIERLQRPEYAKSPKSRRSWADMAQEDLEDEEEEARYQFSNNSGRVKGRGELRTARKPELSREQRERIRFSNVAMKRDFMCLERVNGKPVNILDGLELHLNIFSLVEQKKIVDFVYELQEKGMNGKLKARTFTASQKWMRGKGGVTIQFGCCYNYETDKNGNPPGILHDELVDPIPHLFKVIIKKLVTWHVLPPTCVPDSCIVNIYDEGDCIPPHIDNHDFLRPFCTVSFLSECNILFGTNLKREGPGEFSGAYKIPLPVGSVLVLNGNGADVAKHCVPAVPTKRISITFRKMDGSKWPAGFVPEPDLQGLKPLTYESDKPMGGSIISKPSSHPSNRQPYRRDETRGLLGSEPRFNGQSQTRPDLQGLDPLTYELDRSMGGLSISKPSSHPLDRQPLRRDDARGLQGSQPRFYGQSQMRQQGPSPGYRRNGRSEY